MRSMLKLKANLVHLNSHAQDLQWREWELLKRKLLKRIKRTLRQLTKKYMDKRIPLPMKMSPRLFLQNQPWVRLAACKLNLLKRSSLDLDHQRVFFKFNQWPKSMTPLTSQTSSMLIPMSSITDNLFAEKFLDQLLFFPIWATKTSLFQCQLPKRKALKPILFLDNTTEKSCLLPMKMELLSKTVKKSSTAGSLKILWAKNFKRKSRLKLVQIKTKSSSSLWKLPRTNWPRELFLSSISKWKRNQISIKSNLTTKAQRS